MDDFIFNTINILRQSAYTLIGILPYVLGGVLVGEILKLTSWSKIFLKFSNKSGILGMLLASLIGMASPVCTFGTVPVCIQLYKSGAKLPPLITFLSASTLMNPQMFIWTWGLIGPKMALLRIATVLLTSLFLGFLSGLIPSEKLVSNKIHDTSENLECEILSRPSLKKTTIKEFLMNYWKSLEYILFYLMIGLILSIIIRSYVDQTLVSSLITSDKWYSVLVAAILGVPLYQCGGVAIPIISNLMETGMGYGSALTFFLVGPATNFSPIAAFATIIKPKFVAVYVAVLILFAVLIGYIFNMFT